MSSEAKAGRFLTERRRARGVSQADLAARVGMTQSNISRIERDKVSPSLSTLDRLLGAMGEGLAIGSVELDSPPPGGGNVTIRELRREFSEHTPGERIEQAAAVSRAIGALAAGRVG